ncbi:MAG: ABC transporter ATP-binding protein, partial [Xanthomonadales bacterium]|nr:ABC transporter ATP-binding protein [Xanthomonadales bacterium]
RSSTKALLAKLDREVFVFDLVEPLAETPSVEGYAITRVDETTLEVDLPRGSALNRLFAGLDRAGVQVASMRNKSNRLEELFVRLTGKAA